MHSIPLRTLLLVTIWTLFMSGCSGLGGLAPEGQPDITVDSDPSQATVMADGAELGVTPLTFNPSDVFRASFTGGGDGLLLYRYTGKLIVKKAGCKDSVTEVDDNILSKDMHIKLECDPDYRPTAAPAMTTPETQQTIPATVEERLQRIDALHKKGLISNDEHRQLRQRVLDTL